MNEASPETAAETDFDVLIVGGGPVGLSLAGELGRRSVEVCLVEAKNGLHVHPRSTVISPRTMEHFRSWGIDQTVMAHALPPEYPLDVAFTDRLVGEEFGRFRFPTIGDMGDVTLELERRYPALGWSPYAKTIIGQNALEPLLHAFATSHSSVSAYAATSVVAVEERDGHVAVTVQRADGTRQDLTARFVVGCDGGRSLVRKSLGVALSGVGKVGESVSIFFRAPDLLRAAGKTPAFLFWTFAEGATGSFVAIDGSETWVHSRHLMPHETYADFDPAAAVLNAVGADIEIEILSHWHWIPRELTADTYGLGRVLLAGDAAHLMSPTGGLGLNTGVGDVVNLAWKLQAVLDGWGGAGLMASYTVERRPVAIRNARESTENRELMKQTMLAARELYAGDADKVEARATIQRGIPRHMKHFDGNGLYLGDDYAGSPIVVDDGSPRVDPDPHIYQPIARPGRRLPHFWVKPRVSIHDCLGQGFTLLRIQRCRTDGLLAAFRRRGVPIDVVNLAPESKPLVGASVVIVRPDGHVGWRGAGDPTDGQQIVDQLCGSAAASGGLDQA
ncbi:hypothetical protein AZG88_02355 [Rhodococcus sp. LB1]|nr:FAD-dependent monooxygenase [Rhodococcus sp. LB1]KXX55893.1 hypothetical protein AZG88_02355 [Rhodococcus sp. LB1]